MAKTKAPAVTDDEIKRWPRRTVVLGDLDAAAYNPRRITEHAMGGLRNSLRRFGVVQPIVWNERTNRIVGGHQRRDALVAEGVMMDEVIAVDLDEPSERALNLALNNPGLQGTWDDTKLSDMLKDFSTGSLGLDGIVDELRLDELIATYGTWDVDLETPHLEEPEPAAAPAEKKPKKTGGPESLIQVRVDSDRVDAVQSMIAAMEGVRKVTIL